MATVARNIVGSLHASGVRRMYGVSGDSLNGLTDALRDHGGVEWVPVRHEESAAFAASAESQLTGELAVCAGSCGPGNLHLVNGLFDAQRTRTPVLAIAAHIPSEEIGSGYFQETHPQELFRECSVYVEHVSSADQMPRLLRTAMRAAVEQRGVAVLVISGDVALTELDAPAEAVRHTPSTVVPADTLLAEAAQALNAAQRITILAGAGAAGAHREVVALAERLQAPIVHAMRGKEHLEYDNPYDVGLTGLLGFSSGYKALKGAETLLILGSSLPYRQFYPEDATVIQVDIRGEQIGRRIAVDVPLVGGVKETAEALLLRLRGNASSAFLEEILKEYRTTRKDLDELATPSRSTIHPQYLARLIDERAADDAVFIPDVGSPVIWAARYLTMNGRRRLIGSMNHGSMANAIMQSIGAQAAYPGRQVIALAGDGGLSMMLGELLTLVQNGLPVKVVVFNNSSLNFVELEMKAAGFVTFATDLKSPDFSVVGEAVGLRGFHAETSKELPDAVDAFLAHEGPAILDVTTERQELTIPPSVEAEQAKGFALYAIRTVLDGKGTELIDLAKANIRQLF
ncbi:ubiquinone-dependent pyruvate dehydrogenase [Micrococcus sp. EYE_162]|uniref:ubiquinone-dependent pyruvate dehydrogenase n=1 Tax=unclassified Micrococcus TaxID=2620948 RepID=UPI00200457A9|nr:MULTISPECIES: ubiquinone-dependent pyruvate dehydrogenase [unclassified Micrococcus]MCK6095455.1 ubiquinone-dependent pyruvate dehydrogenase [Micrococcus sp. EYE_212]MCK6171530.1 ubiquinone-dependent pyruvate dehydrogenase [Micrococcus sp. EYE_162]